MKYIFKDTVDYVNFISWLMIRDNAQINRTLETPDGPIICNVRFNKYWVEFQLYVDGSHMCATPDLFYVLSELNGMFTL